MSRYGEKKLTITGDEKNRRKLMKILNKAKATYTRVRTIKDEEGANTGFDIECYVSNHKIWKILEKLDPLGDLTIE